jgi:DNA-binding transcriptional LysR family regulator
MNLNHLVVFRAVAEKGSFTAAATALSADKAHVSRVVRALEHTLGVVLVARTTRHVVLTTAGQALLATIRGPLDVLNRAGSILEDRTATPTGTVTVTTTPDLARVMVAPLLPSFRARFPEVSVRLRVGLEVEPLTDPHLDLALRVGQPRGGDVKVRKLGELEAGFYASPRYLSVRGVPKALRELEGHDTAWPHGDKKMSFGGAGAPPAPSIACDDFAVILEVTRASGGVGVLPLHLARSHVREGSLVRLLPSIALGGAPLYLVTRRERPLPPRVEALRSHLISNVGALLAGA